MSMYLAFAQLCRQGYRLKRFDIEEFERSKAGVNIESSAEKAASASAEENFPSPSSVQMETGHREDESMDVDPASGGNSRVPSRQDQPMEVDAMETLGDHSGD